MRLLPIFAFLTLAACMPPAAPQAGPALPPGVIALASGGYMQPMGADGDGCMRYQAHDPGKLTTQVIQYRKSDGSFTMQKSEADCDRR